MALEDPRGVIRWLLSPDNERHLEVLDTLSSGEQTAPDLQSCLDIDHPEMVYRSLRYLQDRGLVSEFRDFSEEQDGAIYEISPIGERILEAVREVQDLLSDRSASSRHAFAHSVRSGAFDQTIQLRRGAEVFAEIGTYSEGDPEDTVTVRA